VTVPEIAYLLRTRLAEQLATGLTEEDDQLSFLQLGVDSVIATELIEFIRREVEPEASVSVLFDFPTVNELALHLAKRDHVDSEGSTADRAGSSDGVPESETYSQALPAVASSKPGQYSNVAISATPRMPIAVVGISGRFPGANNVRELWRNLAAGVCSIAEIPIQRSRYWDLSNLALRAGRTCLWGGFLNDVECFDPHFFNIPSSEACVMDPQQRLFLEEAWNAIEDAGYASDALSESRCGVYVGVMNTDYQDLLTHVTAQAPKVHELVGSAASILAARIAHHLNLRGPAIAMDTACSSSMVAIDLACRALEFGEIDMALAGGVTLYLTQKRYNLMEQAGMLSQTGLCRPFDEAADGMIPGEGVGVVVLKRLEDSLADGDSIYGVIIASGTNHAGKTNGITAPSAQSQFELIREVYRRSNIDPATIQYVEGHGTGTRLGDPIEVEALTKIFQTKAREGQFCRLGSIKANLGHTTAAAGVAGLIKVLLSLQHRAIPPQIHFDDPNRHTDYASSPFRVNTVLEPWEGKDGRPRRAAVSSFGFSGTNAHLVVQEAPPTLGYETSQQRAGFWITLSAKNSKGLERKAHELAYWLATEGENASIIDLSYTLAIGRSAFDERLAFVAHDLLEVRAGLQQFLTSLGDDLHLWRGRAGPAIGLAFI
jgi:acyl transferase domain-containing protein/acyl carrier protein